jgi:hypothetical protein
MVRRDILLPFLMADVIRTAGGQVRASVTQPYAELQQATMQKRPARSPGINWGSSLRMEMLPMSAEGHKPTQEGPVVMSALPPQRTPGAASVTSARDHEETSRG